MDISRTALAHLPPYCMLASDWGTGVSKFQFKALHRISLYRKLKCFSLIQTNASADMNSQHSVELLPLGQVFSEQLCPLSALE